MRGTTIGSAARILAAVLLALQFFAPSASFASVHTLRHVEAKAEPGNELTGTSVRDEAVTHRGCGPPGDPTDPLRTRDRHRGVAAVHACLVFEQPPEGKRWVTAPPRVPPSVSSRPERTGAAHTPALLQVFRC
ncbi:hypothetical protein GCM10010145_12630 [Streptomyces ruber]|uniref:Secreted protein n=2 Tax=Streptomyces TaxID=1883 RepID=A0A918B913_9ACTN|nr:hypothetical protein GCM10010145_12630 [Streptomyces ruber]